MLNLLTFWHWSPTWSFFSRPRKLIQPHILQSSVVTFWSIFFCSSIQINPITSLFWKNFSLIISKCSLHTNSCCLPFILQLFPLHFGGFYSLKPIIFMELKSESHCNKLCCSSTMMLLPMVTLLAISNNL